MTEHKPTGVDFPRIIRSFVRREGRMTPTQKRAMDEWFPIYGVEFDGKQLDITDLFEQQQDCILEIGFGMGQSLLDMCEADPDHNYLGIEVHRPGVGNVLDGIKKRNLKNLRVLCADAKEVLLQGIADNSLRGVLIYFPDPWPKKRHHKRRLIQPDFIKLIARKLQADGFLHVATDWQDYAEHALQVVTESRLFASPEKSRGQRPLTKYEKRGQRLGHDIWDYIFYKS